MIIADLILLFDFPMIKNVISPNDFERLLDWLDQNRETAAQKYETIRQKLIRIFCGRGCFAAEELADETFDRVTSKLPAIIENYTGEPALYFYGVANKIHLEWLRKQAKTEQLEFEERLPAKDAPESDAEFVCLENCLAQLPAEQHRLIIDYYQKQKSRKIELRKQMADRLGVSAGTLQTRIYRLRQRLRECVSDCVEKNL